MATYGVVVLTAAGPATVMNDLIWIGVVLRAASSVKELPVRPQVAQEAREAASTQVERCVLPVIPHI